MTQLSNVLITDNSTIKTNYRWSKHPIIVSFLRQIYGLIVCWSLAESNAVTFFFVPFAKKAVIKWRCRKKKLNEKNIELHTLSDRPAFRLDGKNKCMEFGSTDWFEGLVKKIFVKRENYLQMVLSNHHGKSTKAVLIYDLHRQGLKTHGLKAKKV